MRFKTDENLHPDAAALLRSAGHDALTIWDQDLRGRPDTDIAAICRAESRALVTLDLDFADIRRYPPEQYAGILVLRVGNQSKTHVLSVIQSLLPLLTTQPLQGRLWIADEQAVRIRQSLN